MTTSPLKYVVRELDPKAREFYARLADGVLSTTWCSSCDRPFFPPRERCADCGGALEWRPLARRGIVYAFTQQERGLRFTKPDTVGIAELDDGARVFGLFEDPFDRLAIGAPVDVVTRPDDSGLTLLVFRLRES